MSEPRSNLLPAFGVPEDHLFINARCRKHLAIRAVGRVLGFVSSRRIPSLLVGNVIPTRLKLFQNWSIAIVADDTLDARKRIAPHDQAILLILLEKVL